MKLYKCDICGKLFDPGQIGCNLSDKPLAVPGMFGVAASGLDVCQACMRAGSNIDFKEAIVGVWKGEVRS